MGREQEERAQLVFMSSFFRDPAGQAGVVAVAQKTQRCPGLFWRRLQRWRTQTTAGAWRRRATAALEPPTAGKSGATGRLRAAWGTLAWLCLPTRRMAYIWSCMLGNGSISLLALPWSLPRFSQGQRDAPKRYVPWLWSPRGLVALVRQRS